MINIGDITDLLTSYFDQHTYSSIVVIVDQHTHRHCYPIVEKSLPKHHLIEIKAGEEYKNIETCMHVWAEMSRFSVDRKSCVVNLGGGVISDLGGFCASTYKRGIPFINIPTTLLAMTDAAIGGKVGVDFDKFKNHIGVFNSSLAVLIDPVFLKTLDDRNTVSGAAETIKHALISAMELAPIFESVRQRSFDKKFIEESVGFKQGIVQEDALEHNKRKILNFGHTIGHAIESYFLDKPELLLHGEAIIMGMICELFLSHTKVSFPENKMHDLIRQLNSVFSFRAIRNNEMEQIALISKQDKKNSAHLIQAVLLQDVGQPKIDVTITEAEIHESLSFYNKCLI